MLLLNRVNKSLFHTIVVPLLLTLSLVISLNNRYIYYVVLEITALLLSLIGVVYYYSRHYYKHTFLPRNNGLFFYLAFCGWAGLSVLWSGAQITSLLALKPFIGGILAIIIGYSYSTRQAKIQMQLLLALAVFLSLYTFYQAALLGINRPAALLLDWNTHAAFLTLLLLPLCSRFLIQQQQHQNSYATGALCSLLLLAISFTLSRGAFLSLAIGLLLISYYALQHKIKVSYLLKLCAWLAVGYLLAELFNQHESFGSRFNSTVNANNLEALGSGRHLQWKPAWAMFLDRPLLGWGFGTFHLLFAQYKAPLTAEAGFYAHNDYLQFLLELGPIGLLLFLGFVASLIFYAVQLGKKNTGELSVRHFYSFTLLAACLGMLVHSALNFNLYQLPIQMLLGLYVGLALHDLYARQMAFIPVEVMSAKRYYAVLFGFSVPLLLALSFVLGALHYEHQSQVATNPNDKLDYAWKAQLFSPFLAIFDYQKTLQLTELLKYAPLSVADKQEISEMAQELINQAIYKNALNPLNYVAKAQLLQATDVQAMNGKKVKHNYEQALVLNPYALKIRDQYASYLIAQQQEAQALTILWDAWGRHTVDFYQNGIVFLTRQLQINQRLGNPDNNSKITREINKLIALKATKPAGAFVFQK
jgi:O-antigen ligase